MNERFGPILTKIGRILSTDSKYPVDGTFLHVDFEEGAIGPSVFRDLGDRLIYEDATRELGDALFDLWEAEEPARRWTVMEYLIVGDSFDARFSFDPIPEDDDSIERRDRVLAARYGNKQIVYPPMDTEFRL